MDLSRYTISGQKELIEAMALSNRRLIAIRWVYIGLLVAVASAASIYSTHSYTSAIQYVAIMAFAYSFNAAFLIMAITFKHNRTVQQLITASQLLIDLLVAGVTTYIQGGLEARTTVMYMFPIMSAGLLFSGRTVMGVAATSGLIYAGAIAAQGVFVRGDFDMTRYLVPMVFYPVIFLLLARIAVYLGNVGSTETREKAYDSFLSLIAHQLKHPVSAASAIIDTIVHGGKTSEKDRLRYMEMLRGENENLVRLIDNLIETASSKRPIFRDGEIDLISLLDRMGKRAGRINGREDDLNTATKSKKAIVKGDEFRLGLALNNIFDNAFRYSDDGTKVSYRVAAHGNDRVEINISDHGRGMSRHQQNRLFRRYAKAMGDKDAQGHDGGLGLGLYVARKIIRSHGGTLEIESSEGSGTHVTVLLRGVIDG